MDHLLPLLELTLRALDKTGEVGGGGENIGGGWRVVGIEVNSIIRVCPPPPRGDGFMTVLTDVSNPPLLLLLLPSPPLTVSVVPWHHNLWIW